MRYRIMYRTRVHPGQLAEYPVEFDLLLSAYNAADRVQKVFSTVSARRRVWVVQPEYGYLTEEIPTGPDVVSPTSARESEFVRVLLDSLGGISSSKVCVDITGFMSHTLLLLVRQLVATIGDRFWLIYSDPGHYVADERTKFASSIREVRQVDGFQGSHDPSDPNSDHLVLGTGYDAGAMRAVVEHKRHAWRTDLLGLPSLQPSMYQENVLAVSGLAGAPGERMRGDVVFAAANDPFATAEALDEVVFERRPNGRNNLYLAPTGTKAQVVGFGLFYLAQCQGTATSIIVPLPYRYERETSEGHARSWIYEVDTRFLRSESNAAGG